MDIKDALSADLVGISTITCTPPRAYTLAKVFTEKDIPTVLGGVHTTFCLMRHSNMLHDFSLVIGGEKVHLLPISTSRGCPFSCTFCSVSKMFGKGYRFRSIESVREELLQVKDKNFVFFVMIILQLQKNAQKIL